MADRKGPPPPANEIERYLRGPFLGALAHAIRSPIGVVQGAVDELRETRDPEDLTWLLPMLDRGIERLLRLAHNLSLVRDIETGRLTPSLTACDLVTVAKRGAAIEHPEAKRLQVRLPTEPIRAECDGSLLELSLEQLIDNALRYGQGEVHVEVGDEPVPRIDVWDEGPGLPPERFDQMTQRFVDARARGAKGDLALGLSIARDTATLGGATLSVLPAPGGRGTLCRLQFEGSGDAP